MPRGPRLDSPGILHHVMVRGIDKGEIFIDDIDRADFIRRIGIVAELTATRLYAFALMGNHAHMLLKSGDPGLPAFMRRLLTGYALQFNRRHKRVGHLFQNRYKSIVCEEEAYFRKLVAYINLNPLLGGLVGSIEELEKFAWCGQADLLGSIRHPWLDRRYVLGFFGGTEPRALCAYAKYLQEELGQPIDGKLDGGGRTRSISAAKDSGKQGSAGRGDAAAGDERILGSGEFVRDMLQHAEARKSGRLRQDELLAAARKEVDAVCLELGVSAGQLRSGARYGALSKARMKLVDKLVDGLGLSLAEAARQLGVSISAVYQIRQRIIEMKALGKWERK